MLKERLSSTSIRNKTSLRNGLEKFISGLSQHRSTSKSTKFSISLKSKSTAVKTSCSTSFCLLKKSKTESREFRWLISCFSSIKLWIKISNTFWSSILKPNKWNPTKDSGIKSSPSTTLKMISMMFCSTAGLILNLTQLKITTVKSWEWSITWSKSCLSKLRSRRKNTL